LATGAPVSLRTSEASTKRPACWALFSNEATSRCVPLVRGVAEVEPAAASASVVSSAGPSSSDGET
jgi:hypothetical protein